MIESTKKTGDYDGDASNNTRILPPYSQPVSINNNTTTGSKSQIAPLPSKYNMQQNRENDANLNTKIE